MAGPVFPVEVEATKAVHAAPRDHALEPALRATVEQIDDPHDERLYAMAEARFERDLAAVRASGRAGCVACGSMACRAAAVRHATRERERAEERGGRGETAGGGRGSREHDRLRD